MTMVKHAWLLALVMALGPAVARAGPDEGQSAPAQPAQPTVRPQSNAPASETKPGDTGGTSGEPLSHKLSRSGGVIAPPPVNDPSVKVPPPAGNTPLIAPPGTPGGNQNVVPK